MMHIQEGDGIEQVLEMFGWFKDLAARSWHSPPY